MHDCTAIVPAMVVMMVPRIWSTFLIVDHFHFIRFEFLGLCFFLFLKALPYPCFASLMQRYNNFLNPPNISINIFVKLYKNPSSTIWCIYALIQGTVFPWCGFRALNAGAFPPGWGFHPLNAGAVSPGCGFHPLNAGMFPPGWVFYPLNARAVFPGRGFHPLNAGEVSP